MHEKQTGQGARTPRTPQVRLCIHCIVMQVPVDHAVQYPQNTVYDIIEIEDRCLQGLCLHLEYTTVQNVGQLILCPVATISLFKLLKTDSAHVTFLNHVSSSLEK